MELVLDPGMNFRIEPALMRLTGFDHYDKVTFIDNTLQPLVELIRRFPRLDDEAKRSGFTQSVIGTH